MSNGMFSDCTSYALPYTSVLESVFGCNVYYTLMFWKRIYIYIYVAWSPSLKWMTKSQNYHREVHSMKRITLIWGGYRGFFIEKHLNRGLCLVDLPHPLGEILNFAQPILQSPRLAWGPTPGANWWHVHYITYSPSRTFCLAIRDDFSINYFTKSAEKFLQFSWLHSVANVANKHFAFICNHACFPTKFFRFLQQYSRL